MILSPGSRPVSRLPVEGSGGGVQRPESGGSFLRVIVGSDDVPTWIRANHLQGTTQSAIRGHSPFLQHVSGCDPKGIFHQSR
jgi:hypothetical protein